jgi:hypothetical protein
MTEMVMSGSMSGDEKRSDGLLGESDNERRRSQSAPPVLHATALDLDSTNGFVSLLLRVRPNALLARGRGFLTPSASSSVRSGSASRCPGDYLLRACLDHLRLVEPERVEAHRVLGVKLTPLPVGQLLHRLNGVLVVRRVALVDHEAPVRILADCNVLRYKNARAATARTFLTIPVTG